MKWSDIHLNWQQRHDSNILRGSGRVVVLALLLANLASSAYGQGGIEGTTALVPNAYTPTFEGLEVAQHNIAVALYLDEKDEALADQRLVSAIESLQAVHEQSLGKNYVVLPRKHTSWSRVLAHLRSTMQSDENAATGISGGFNRGRSEPDEEAMQKAAEGQVYLSASNHIISIFHSLPPMITETYRARFDTVAAAGFHKALLAKDADMLWDCSRRYPLSTVSTVAAVLAADLYLELGLVRPAAAALDGILLRQVGPTILSTANAKLLPEFVGAGTSLYALAKRHLLLAVQLRDKSRFREWTEALQLLDNQDRVALPIELRPSEDRFYPWDEPSGMQAVLPRFPYAKVGPRVHWKSVPFDTKYFKNTDFRSVPSAVRYASKPVLGKGWVLINTPRRLLRFDIETGLKLQGFELRALGRAGSASRGSPSSARLGRRSGSGFFVERDSKLLLVPTIGLARGEQHGHLIGSYVRTVTKKEEYSGYAITTAVPTRSLTAIRGHSSRGRLVWDTGSRATRRHDPKLFEMSFNGPTLAKDGRLYAVGYRRAGFIEAHLVCLDLATGQALWKTHLVDNQIDLTMFGELAFEPFVGGVAERDGRIYASTNLGVVASVSAYDGTIEWLMPYRGMDVRPSTQMRRQISRNIVWERNPVIVYQDRLFVTPLDSSRLFSIERKTGKILQSKDVQRLGSYMVGLHENHLVFAERNTATAVRARDLLTHESTVNLAGMMRARPALVKGGLVYTTEAGLYYRALFSELGGVVDNRQLVAFAEDSHPFSNSVDHLVDGEVLISEEYVMIASSRGIRCYKGRKE